MHLRLAYGVLVLGLSAVMAVGCAKRPATIAATSSPPPPTAGVAAPKVAGDARRGPTAAATFVRATSGSTAAARPEPREFSPVADLRDIHFDFDKYSIRSEDRDILEANAAWLKAHPTFLILIEGHCDERGTNEYNLALGERRARAALTYLVGLGVSARRIGVLSYGEERPLCTESTESCWSKNRRAHFLVKQG